MPYQLINILSYQLNSYPPLIPIATSIRAQMVMATVAVIAAVFIIQPLRYSPINFFLLISISIIIKTGGSSNPFRVCERIIILIREIFGINTITVPIISCKVNIP